MRRDRSEYHRKYRERNIVRMTRYKEENRVREAEKARKKRKTPYGLLYHQYMHQAGMVNKRPKYSLIEYLDYALLDENFRKIFIDWRESGYDKFKVPSCDRIDATKPYALDNIQFVTWQENWDKRDIDTIHVLAKKRGYKVRLIKE